MAREAVVLAAEAILVVVDSKMGTETKDYWVSPAAMKYPAGNAAPVKAAPINGGFDMKPRTEHYYWKTVTHHNCVTLTKSNLNKIGLDVGLKVVGGIACYGIGWGLGEIMDQIPYLNTWIPQAIDSISGIQVAGNLDGLVGLICGLTGIVSSGTETNVDT